MGKVREILQSKQESICTVEPDITVYRAIELMSEKNIAAVIILEEGRLAGIFTEHDYTRKVVLKGKSSKATSVGELMSRSPYSVNSESTVEECMGLMNSKKIRHLPVVDNGNLVGVVSVGDLIRFIIEEQRTIIEHLEHYITQ
ncbi:MAG TPA: CBS domain-containing protein [Cyclobacteriaceae bacterium]|nr:CBS domain-containing protein [Cyclobacteriaceae bacterium]